MEKKIKELSCKTLLVDVSEYPLNFLVFPHRLEVIAAFVAAKAPTGEELSSFLNRRQINESILQRPELQCVIFSTETNRWIYDFELDSENLIGA
jgi:hypothetical protein